jgi:drug/metabolite transporter (DMT)-like permease
LLKRGDHLEARSAATFGGAALLSAGIATLTPGPSFPNREALLWALASGIFEGVYIICLVRALSRASLGWAYTWMRGSAVLAVWPLAQLASGEKPTLLTAASAGLVLLGLLALGLRQGERHGPRAWPWTMGAGVSIAAYNLCYKAALDHGAKATGLFAVSLGLGLAIQLGEMATRRSLPRPGQLFGRPLALVLTSAVCAGGFLFYLVAMQTEGAARVTTLRNTSVVFALLMAWALGERPGRNGWIGAALVALGAGGLGWRP